MTAYPDAHRRTTQRPRLQETSATPGIAVQSTPTGENASKGVMQPPPAHDTVSSCNHVARAVSTRRNTLTALEIVLRVDALPGFARPAPLLRDSARGVTALTHPAPGRRSVVRRCRTLFRSYGGRTTCTGLRRRRRGSGRRRTPWSRARSRSHRSSRKRRWTYRRGQHCPDMRRRCREW